jgi:hypothetical protein
VSFSVLSGAMKIGGDGSQISLKQHRPKKLDAGNLMVYRLKTKSLILRYESCTKRTEEILWI